MIDGEGDSGVRDEGGSPSSDIDPFGSGVDPFASGVDPFASTPGGAGKNSPRSLGGGVQAMSADELAGGGDGYGDNDFRPIDLTGVVLGNLHIERKLGQGGMGEVWRGRNVDLDVPVAVKVLPPEMAADPQFVMRFVREARAVAMLDHPNIVRVFDAGRRECQGRVLRVMVMELVEGKDALEMMLAGKGGKLSPREAAEVALGAAKALRYAHSKAVIHRDIKPANILVGGGKLGGPRLDAVVKVLDFGLARVLEDRIGGGPSEGLQSGTGHIVGTPHYMPPEQARGLAVDGRADVYSLGVTLYELLTGSLPFEGGTAFSIIEGHVREPMPFPRERFADVPESLRGLVEGMCAKEADDRIPLKQVIEGLERFLGISQVSAATPRSMVTTAVRHNISTPANTFIGREREFGELAELFAEGARLVTVMGPGGVGKTRFTQEFGLRVVGSYSGGVWFCDLTEARTVDGVCHAVGMGMGIPLTTADGVAQIHAAMRMRGAMLIVLDNFEQVTEFAAATVGVWMKDTSEVRFLVSSREPLHVRGEQGYPLQPLDGADGAAGVELFLDRAREVKPGYQPDAETVTAITELVRQLDGIPLAIELAAARVSAMSPQQILLKMPRRFDLLTSRRRDASARQMTLRGAIEWSWDLLKPWEQAAMAQCSVFVDGFFLDAAEAVIDLSEFPEAPFTMDVVEALVEKSLLRAYAVPQLPGETRYRMLESIRDFAAWKMGSMGGNAQSAEHDVSRLRRRHAEFYVGYAEHWQKRVGTHSVVEALTRGQIELENLFAVQDTFAKEDPELAAKSIIAQFEVMRIRGPWQDLVTRLERALSGLTGFVPTDARLLDNPTIVSAKMVSLLVFAYEAVGVGISEDVTSKMAIAMAEKVDTASPSAESKRVLSMAYRSCYIRGNGSGDLHDESLPILKKSEEAARAANDVWLAELARVGAAIPMLMAGRFDEAQELLLSSKAVLQKIGDKHAIAGLIHNQGMLFASRSELDKALACYAEAAELNRELGNKAWLARNYGGSGSAHFLAGRYEESLKQQLESLRIYREMGIRLGTAGPIYNIAEVLQAIGKYAESETYFAEALALGLEYDAVRLVEYVYAMRPLAFVKWAIAGAPETKRVLTQALSDLEASRKLRYPKGLPEGQEDAEPYYTAVEARAWWEFARLGGDDTAECQEKAIAMAAAAWRVSNAMAEDDREKLKSDAKGYFQREAYVLLAGVPLA